MGTQTVLVDNPRLTARTPDGEPAEKQPLRAVMGLRRDSRGRRGQRRRRQGAALADPEPREALDRLFDAGVRHLMVEGGSRILSAFLAAGLVDELIVYLAPTLLGSGTLALDDLGIGTLADAQHWDWDGPRAAPSGCWPRPAAAPASRHQLFIRFHPRSNADTAAGGN